MKFHRPEIEYEFKVSLGIGNEMTSGKEAGLN